MLIGRVSMLLLCCMLSNNLYRTLVCSWFATIILARIYAFSIENQGTLYKEAHKFFRENFIFPILNWAVFARKIVTIFVQGRTEKLFRGHAEQFGNRKSIGLALGYFNRIFCVALRSIESTAVCQGSRF